MGKRESDGRRQLVSSLLAKSQTLAGTVPCLLCSSGGSRQLILVGSTVGIYFSLFGERKTVGMQGGGLLGPKPGLIPDSN